MYEKNKLKCMQCILICLYTFYSLVYHEQITYMIHICHILLISRYVNYEYFNIFFN